MKRQLMIAGQIVILVRQDYIIQRIIIEIEYFYNKFKERL